MYAGSAGSLIAVTLSLLLIFPLVSANAESFSVTTNKDIYTLNEKIIVVGIVPAEVQTQLVLINITGPSGNECTSANTLPDSDNSYLSRPIKIEQCGVGQYSVTASYSNFTSTASFTISGKNNTDIENRLELRMIKNVILHAQERINAKILEIIETNSSISQQAADMYSNGFSEASVAIEALEFGDNAQAKRHQLAAIKYFKEFLKLVSIEQTAAAKNPAVEDEDDDDNSQIITLNEDLARMQEFYDRLVELSEKNDVDKDKEFEQVVSLLHETRIMISQGNTTQAYEHLTKVNGLLESIRVSLFEAVEQSKIATTLNSTKDDEEDDERLGSVADKLERKANKLLNETVDPDVVVKIKEALSFIATARLEIEEDDYDSAKQSLRKANDSLTEARKLIESEDDSEAEDEEKDEEEGEDSEDSDKEKDEENDHDDGNDDDNSGSNEDSESEN